MPILQEIIDLIDLVAPFDLAADWDNCGLMTGSRSAEVNKALVALDPTPESAAAAEAIGAQLLLTHHPLIFRPVKCLDYDDLVGAVIRKAVKADIAVASAHTNLDAAAGGVNQVLAERLGLNNIEPMEPVKSGLREEAGEGFGRLGRLDRPMSPRELGEMVLKKLGAPGLRIAAGSDRKIEKIAVMGGSGGSYIQMAKDRGASALVTGDISHHQAGEAAYLGLCLIDAGHFATERPVIEQWARALDAAARDRDLAVEFNIFSEERDPWTFMEE